MKEELQTALTDLISKTVDSVDKTKDFMIAELPDVLQQLLMWHGISNFVECVIAIVVIIGATIIINDVLNNKKGIEWKTRDTTMPQIKELIKFAISGVASFISLFSLNLVWLKCWIAPKVWLIEYMSSLIKK